MCICVLCVSLGPVKAMRSLGAGIIDGSELSRMGAASQSSNSLRAVSALKH